MQKNNVMWDIETLGTRANSIVLSIGAVKFDPLDTVGSFGEEFYAVLSIEDQQEKYRVSDKSTISWWTRQPKEAQEHCFSICDSKRAPVADVLVDLSTFLMGDYVPWGNGSDFDNTIIADLFKCFGEEVPWDFWNNRCFRTLKSTFRHLVREPAFEGIKHHALHDAKHQARYCQLIHHKLKSKGVIV